MLTSTAEASTMIFEGRQTTIVVSDYLRKQIILLQVFPAYGKIVELIEHQISEEILEANDYITSSTLAAFRKLEELDKLEEDAVWWTYPFRNMIRPIPVLVAECRPPGKIGETQAGYAWLWLRPKIQFG